MIKRFCAVAGATAFLAGGAWAAASAPVPGGEAPVGQEKKQALTEVNVCPMTGEKVVGKGAGHSVVGKYDVHFCCGGCKPEFDKLSLKEKQSKIASALKKQAVKS